MEINFSESEKRILKFWQENKIFEKSIIQRKKAADFVFYEGPPTANAKPGIHHVLARVFKDIICRYKTMQGFRVLRKAGWDTHGLPVELEIEKKLGLKSKKDIEKFGIAKFNKLCKESVWSYKNDWEKLTERIAFWLDIKHPYITYTPEYIETVWWIIKQIWRKGLLYKDYKVVPYCPRCGTSLSSHEVAQGYKKVKENSVYVKFPVKGEKNTYFLVWTTTPWTLPGNVAIAINPKLQYTKIQKNDEFYYLYRTDIFVTRHFESLASIVNVIDGRDLLGKEYEPLYDFIKPEKKAYYVIAGDFVSTEEGTGLVHIAPAFGEEDMEVGKENNLPVILNVDEEGKFKPEVKNWAGLGVKDADPLIIEELKKRNLLFKEELYEHDYPFCWRCRSPLLYYAKESWFINIQKVKKDLIKNGQKINWIPSHLKKGRFGEWLREIKDWAFSRERYWGTPLPVWECEKCGSQEVIGGEKDLLKQKFSTNKYFILRHGETIYQAEKRKTMYPWPERQPILLTKKGQNQIKKAARELKNKKIDLIYSSDIARTRQTTEIVVNEAAASSSPTERAKASEGGKENKVFFDFASARVTKELKIKVIFDKRLRDINLGVYRGGKKEKFHQDFPNPKERFYKSPKGGESWSGCKKRMFDFLKDIDKKYRDKTILIITHGDPFWLLEGAVKGLNNDELLDQIFVQKNFPKVGGFRQIDFKNFPYDEKGELDFHRPFIDEIKFKCQKCLGEMARVPEVIDCWFDSGAMPFAQGHWPFTKNQKLAPYPPPFSEKRRGGAGSKSPEFFPADYISEAVDQTRGWFYTLLAISTLLGFGSSYKNVISLGHVLDEKGEKMSKSKGNVIDPWMVIEKYSSDAVRWYFYTVNQPGDAKLFKEKDVEGSLRKFIMTFWNSYIFFETYGKSSNMEAKNSKPQLKIKNLLDRWIISKLNGLIQAVTESLDKYDVTGAARAIESFTVEDLSQWHIRRSRRRFHPVVSRFQRELRGRKTRNDFEEASQTLGFVLLTLSKLAAPFVPFLSEEIFEKVKCSSPGDEQSVHLEDWPKTNRKLVDKKLEEKMKEVREIVALALAERAKAGIKVRQPLQKLKIHPKKFFQNLTGQENEKLAPYRPARSGTGAGLKIDEELLGLIKEEVNVKEIIFDDKIKEAVELDTKITSGLKEEGIIREVVRNIQELRKKANLKPKDKIVVIYLASPELNKILEQNKNFLLKEAKVKDLISRNRAKKPFDAEKETKVDGEKLSLGIKKI